MLLLTRRRSDGDGDGDGGDDAGGDGGACGGQWLVQVRIAEHVLSLWTRKMMVAIRVVNRRQPKMRPGRKASPGPSYGF